jgi:hypothetical protein
VVTRGLAYDNGKIFLATLDDYAVALDAASGKELWHTKLGDINLGETSTMAPLVVKGKVLIGNSGGEMGVRGWVTALDENQGTIIWRGYSTGPDADVRIGDDFKAPYDWMKGKDLGVKSWPPNKWRVSDVVGYSRLAGADEDRILARLRALHSDLIDPIIAVHNGRVVKRTGDGAIVEFRSVVDAVRCAIEVQNGMVEPAQMTSAIYGRRGRLPLRQKHACSDFTSIAGCARSVAEAGIENIDISPSSSVFHDVIWLGWTSNCSAD